MIDSAIINGIFVLIAAIIGGVATWQASRNKMRIEQLQITINSKQDKIDKLQNAVDRLSKQVIAYHKLEDEYAQKLPEYKKIGDRAKAKLRKKVSEAGYEYPEMTENKVNTLLKEL